MKEKKKVCKFGMRVMSILFGICLTIAVLVSICMKYYEAISLIIFLGIYIYLLCYGLIMVLTPLKPPNEEEIIEFQKKNAEERKNCLKSWRILCVCLLVITIGIGIGITVDTVHRKEIVEIEKSIYIKNVEEHGNGILTYYDIYKVKYQYEGEECEVKLKYDERFVTWTIKAEHSYVYADKDGARPFWENFFYTIFFDELALLFTGFIITFFINIERVINAAGELEVEEERLAEKKTRKMNYLLLVFTLICFLYFLIMLCIHFFPVFGLKF